MQHGNDAHELLDFLGTLDSMFSLPAVQQEATRHDFLRAVAELSEQGVPLHVAIQRLSPLRLGEFYTKKSSAFYPLDDGSKQYPLSMQKGRMAMFRLTASLREQVHPGILQIALTFTLKRFPHYATRMRKGMFWYYLRPCLARYVIEKDTADVCHPIDLSDDRQQLFRVLYGERSVSVELFHILTDGTGGMIFLKSLLAEYYRLLGEYPQEPDRQILDSAEPSLPVDSENGFRRIPSRAHGDSLVGLPALQFSTSTPMQNRAVVDHYFVSAKELSLVAKAHGVSVTVLLCAIILTACRKTIRASKGRYQIQVPINLRKVFDCNTLRNFAWYCVLTMDAAHELPPDQLLGDLSRQLKAFTQRETLERNISVAQRTIRWLRYVPLQWKSLLMRTAFNITGEFFFTTTLSNLGVIALPAPLCNHVEYLSMALGASLTNPFNLGSVTVNNHAALSVTRTTDDLTFEKEFMHAAKAYGMEVTTEYHETYRKD